jgi:hypothetical protein
VSLELVVEESPQALRSETSVRPAMERWRRFIEGEAGRKGLKTVDHRDQPKQPN